MTTNPINTTISGDAAIVDFTGASLLDSLVIDSISRELYALVEQKQLSKIVLDFSGVKFLASQAIGVLLTLRKKLEPADGKLALCSVNKELTKIFEIMKLSEVLDFYPSVDSAKAGLDIK